MDSQDAPDATLRGCVALITGASRGLGREIAVAFLRSGASVASSPARRRRSTRRFSALQVERLRPDQRVHAIRADLSQHDRCPAIAREVQEELGGIDVLVNNAGNPRPIGALDRTEHVAWTRTMSVNLLAPIALMRAVIPAMRARGRGKIINLSGGGATSPRANFTAYAAAKAAIVRVTETVAEEVRGDGIDVNAVAPGAMNTRLLDEVLDAGPERAGGDEYRRAIAQRANGGSPPAGRPASCCGSPRRGATASQAGCSVRSGTRGKTWRRGAWSSPRPTSTRYVASCPETAAGTGTTSGEGDARDKYSRSVGERPPGSGTSRGRGALASRYGHAACLASHGISTLGYDADSDLVGGLAHAKPPVFEPGLEELVLEGLSRGTLRFTADPRSSPRRTCSGQRGIHRWISRDRGDVEFVVDQLDWPVPVSAR